MGKKKRKEKKRKKLRTLILLLFLTIFMFGTSTYAWFTANRVVNIESIDVHVETSDGIQISSNGTTWKSTLTKADITGSAYTGANNFIPETLEAVSTAGDVSADSGKKTRLLNMFSSNVGTSPDGYTLSTTQVDESTELGKTKFVAFDIFLKVSSNKEVYLNTSDSSSNVVAKDTDRGLKNAARVAFVPIGETSSTATSTEITSAFYTSSPASVKIWEPNNDTHSAAVVNSVGTEYGITGLAATGSSPVTYYGITTEIPTAKAQDLIKSVNGTIKQFDSTTFSKEIPSSILVSTPTTLAADTKIFDLKAGITKMRVYMWVEGQDIDCENNASGTDITFNVELSIRESA